MDQTYTVKSDQTNQIINARILTKFFITKIFAVKIMYFIEKK